MRYHPIVEPKIGDIICLDDSEYFLVIEKTEFTVIFDRPFKDCYFNTFRQNCECGKRYAGIKVIR